MSDYLSFKTSSIYHTIEQEGFLAPDLALYGDCAYVSNRYMVTPFKGVSAGPKDAYNYYQSQVRINIECAFGVLVHRWGLLRRSMPQGISISKTCALVLALCKLHNFCIEEDGLKVPLPAAQDEFNIMENGGVDLGRKRDNPHQPSG